MIVAFAGLAGAGKTTLAKAVQRAAVERDPERFTERFSFAESLKTAADAIWRASDVPYEAFFGTQEDKLAPREGLGGASGRDFMEAFGHFVRSYNADAWLNHLDNYPGHLTVIDDLRYPNEAARVRALGGIVIGVRVIGEPFEPMFPSDRVAVEHWDEMVNIVVEIARGDMVAIDQVARRIVKEVLP